MTVMLGQFAKGGGRENSRTAPDGQHFTDADPAETVTSSVAERSSCRCCSGPVDTTAVALLRGSNGNRGTSAMLLFGRCAYCS
jgi:hypothetical protein